MKVKNIVLGAALVGGIALGAINVPTPGFAAGTPTNVQPNYNDQLFGHMGLYMGQYFQGSMHEIIAEKLGMTSEELYKARVDGKSFADLLKEKDIKAADIVKAVIADREAALNEMVKAKTITEDQKNLMLENMKEMVEAMLTDEAVGVWRAGAGMYRGGGCPMMPGVQPGMGRGRMGVGPMWW